MIAPPWLPSRSVHFLAKIQKKHWCDHKFWFCFAEECEGKGSARCNFQKKYIGTIVKKLYRCDFWRKLCFFFGVITNFSYILGDSTEEYTGNPNGARRPTEIRSRAPGVGANLNVVLRWQQPTAVPELHFGTACPEQAVEQPTETPTYRVSNRLVIRIRNWARMQISMADNNLFA